MLNALLSYTMVKLALFVNPSSCCSRTSKKHSTFLLQCLDLKSKPFLAPRSFLHQKNLLCRCVIQHPAASTAQQRWIKSTSSQSTSNTTNCRNSTFGAVQDLQPSSPCVIHVVPDIHTWCIHHTQYCRTMYGAGMLCYCVEIRTVIDAHCRFGTIHCATIVILLLVV